MARIVFLFPETNPQAWLGALPESNPVTTITDIPQALLDAVGEDVLLPFDHAVVSEVADSGRIITIVYPSAVCFRENETKYEDAQQCADDLSWVRHCNLDNVNHIVIGPEETLLQVLSRPAAPGVAVWSAV